MRSANAIGLASCVLLALLPALADGLTCPNDRHRPCVSNAEATRRLQGCCRQTPMDPYCYKYCDLRVNLLRLHQLNSDPRCDTQNGQLAAKCLTKGQDMTACCRRFRVPDYCLKYCNLSNDPDVGGAELLSLCAPLVASMRKIQRCYWASINP